MKIKNHTIPLLAGLITSCLALAVTAQQGNQNINRASGSNQGQQTEWQDPGRWFNQDPQVSFDYDQSYYNTEYWNRPVQTKASKEQEWSPDFDTAASQPSKILVWDPSARRWRAFQSGRSQQWLSTMTPKASPSQPGQTAFEGTIREIQRAQTQGLASQDRNVLRITLDNGQTQMVDLGQRMDTQQIGLQQGKRLKVTGTMEQVEGQQVLVVQTIQVDGQSFAIQRDSTPSQQVQAQQSETQPSQGRGWDNLEGTIESFRTVQLASPAGTSENHRLATVRRESGETVSVYLGRQEEADQMKLHIGDRIQAKGKQGEVARAQVFLADSLTKNGQRYDVQYQQERRLFSQDQGQEKDSTMAAQAQGDQVMFDGTVEGVREVRVRVQGSGGQAALDRTLVEISLSNGQTQRVDLGELLDLTRLNLQRGAHIRVSGRRAQLGGQQAIQAESIRVDGQQFMVQRDQSRQPTIALQPQPQVPQMETVTGTITGFRRVQVQDETTGTARECMLIRVNLPQGELRVVESGSRDDLERLNLKSGQQVQVIGREGQVNGETAILAESLQVDGQRIDILRPGQETTVSGRIKDLRQVPVGAQRELHLLIRLQLPQGDDIAVDFGPNASIEDLGLQQNDSIRITGQRTRVNGKLILLAREVAVEEPSSQSREDD